MRIHFCKSILLENIRQNKAELAKTENQRLTNTDVKSQPYLLKRKPSFEPTFTPFSFWNY